ncbi:MAG: PD-(D/E)XK nuclease family protein [Candidatus Micrarchaeota archaeon]|nr:PD-(D/E)XK nuclease family protein [Candidatus Micrarchaeota archaeon]
MKAGGSDVLKRLGKSSILVTDIANQFWCERQMEYNYLYGKKYTKFMERGKQLHEELQGEVYVPLTIEPVSYADLMYKIAYENYRSLLSLRDKGICRELRVYGSINGYRLSGQIDEMKIVGGKAKVIERKTTDANRKLTEVYSRPHLMQVRLYRKMLGDIKAGRYTHENFTKTYGLTKDGLSEVFKRELHAMGIKDELINPYSISEKMFSELHSLPELSDRLEVVYVDRFSGKQISSTEIDYNENEVMDSISYAMKFWNGERESAPVVEAENWKCRFCKFFGSECKAWWTGR